MRIGIDIGGTFTDLCAIADDGRVWSTKLLTTPDDPSVGFMDILGRALLGDLGQEPIQEIVHATTMATNAILESKTARLGMITTAGFRDVLEIGRHFRRDIYNLFLEKPPVLVPRQRRLEVSERIAADGSTVHPLNLSEVESVIERLLADQVEVILICFLNSYASPDHEKHVASMIRQKSRVPVVESHAVCGEYREYERFSTAAVHGAIMPAVQRYIQNIEAELVRGGVKAPLSVMQSNGGMASAATIRAQPGLIVESGPAAGVIAAVEIGRRLGLSDLISFDMGGTTAKATLVRQGRITLSTDYEVGGGIQGGFGTGYPIRMPVVDLVEIGTGGGSLAYVDEVGHLHVGPKSAGAEPGPACYGHGGTTPTITDADLVLGRLSAEHFAGGQMKLDIVAATEAIRGGVAEPLGMSVERAAEGVIALANEQMVRALQLVSVERGIDPREFTMIAFGGAGPMHAAELAMELGCRRLVIPPDAGVQSAWGLLVADARRDYARDIRKRHPEANLTLLRDEYMALVERGAVELRTAGFTDSLIDHRLAVDVRYVGQAYELTVNVPDHPEFDPASMTRINCLFHEEHQRLYGHSDAGAAVEWVTLRASVIGRAVRPRRQEVAAATQPLKERQLMVQAMIWAGSSFQAPVFQRSRLGWGDRLMGPALVLLDGASLAIPPGVEGTVAATGDIVLALEGRR